MTAARIFFSRYRRGLFFLSGPGAAAALMFIPPGALILHSFVQSVLVTLLSLWVTGLIWTLWRHARPALTLSAAGVKIDGVPRIAWADVEGVRRRDYAHADALEVRLRRRPIFFNHAVAAATPVWRPAPPRGIILRPNVLEDEPRAIESAFRVFLNPPS